AGIHPDALPNALVPSGVAVMKWRNSHAKSGLGASGKIPIAQPPIQDGLGAPLSALYGSKEAPISTSGKDWRQCFTLAETAKRIASVPSGNLICELTAGFHRS